MLTAQQKKNHMAGTVLFPGALPPRPEELEGIRKAGMTACPRPKTDDEHWSLRLGHPDWGQAVIVCRRPALSYPRELFDYDYRLTDAERETAKRGESEVTVVMERDDTDILRHRKRLLRFLRAVMDDDGVVVVDDLAQTAWSRDALDDELAHDAPLDIDSIFTMHAIFRAPTDGDYRKRIPYWFHSHGLSEIGFFDFDILHPSPDLCSERGSDLLRSLAFSIIEGRAKRGVSRFQLSFPGGFVKFVPLEDFVRAANRADRNLLDHNGHDAKRAVLCEPNARWRGGRPSRFAPSKLLSEPLDDNLVLSFSDDATAMMVERARGTYGQFRKLNEELAEFGFPASVKLGFCPTDQHEHEHLWFLVNELGDREIEATLDSHPYTVEHLRIGDQGRYPVDLLSDWSIMTPLGPISPRSLAAARWIRSDLDRMRAFARLAKEAVSNLPNRDAK